MRYLLLALPLVAVAPPPIAPQTVKPCSPPTEHWPNAPPRSA